MKKLFVFLFLMGTAASIYASPLVSEAPVYPCAAAFNVTLTTYSWTLVPTTQCSGRTIVALNQPYSNSGKIVGIVTTTNVTPVTSTSTWAIEFAPSSDDRGYPLSEESYIWLLTTNTSAETISGQEFRQR